ncbi:MAG: hypothetical protein ABL903_08395 [Methylococcales bacterium]
MPEEASLIEKEKVLMNQVDTDMQAAEQAEPTIAQHTGGASTNAVPVEGGETKLPEAEGAQAEAETTATGKKK